MNTTALAPLQQPDPTTNQQQHQTILSVTFRIGPQQYGLPVSAVIEIVRLPALLTLAGAPPTIIGLLNLRGYYLPILDGAILLGETPHYDINSQIIITGTIGQDGTINPQMGLRVDQVIDVRTLDPNQHTPLRDTISADFLTSVITDNEDSILMMDTSALLATIPDSTTLQPDHKGSPL
jgi:purine-binding chemotaxis protein CheW